MLCATGRCPNKNHRRDSGQLCSVCLETGPDRWRDRCDFRDDIQYGGREHYLDSGWFDDDEHGTDHLCSQHDNERGCNHDHRCDHDEYCQHDDYDDPLRLRWPL